MQLMCLSRLFGKFSSSREMFSAIKTDCIPITDIELKKAKKNNGDALYKIGNEYYKNELFAKALFWFLKACKVKHGASLYTVGYMYDQGISVKTDKELAFKFYLKSAEQEHGHGAYHAGYMYQTGIGTLPNHNQALLWYQTAASNGVDKANYDIGRMFHYGLGITADHGFALMSYKAAARKGNTDAMSGIGDIYRYGLDVELNYETAKEWYQKAGDLGNAVAVKNIGELYLCGQGYDRNVDMAALMMVKAANMGSGEAMYNMGLIYEEEYKSMDMAILWYKRSNEKGNESAAMKLMVLMSEGRIPKDQEKEKQEVEEVDEKNNFLKPLPVHPKPMTTTQILTASDPVVYNPPIYQNEEYENGLKLLGQEVNTKFQLLTVTSREILRIMKSLLDEVKLQAKHNTITRELQNNALKLARAK